MEYMIPMITAHFEVSKHFTKPSCKLNVFHLLILLGLFMNLLSKTRFLLGLLHTNKQHKPKLFNTKILNLILLVQFNLPKGLGK